MSGPSQANDSATAGPTHVVSCFLLRRDRGYDEVLLARRSERVRTYRGAWGAISGYIEAAVTPPAQAYQEIEEETGLHKSDVILLREGEPLAFRDTAIEKNWVVHPFLFLALHPDAVRLDWEAQQFGWTLPAQVTTLETVPKLSEALELVYQKASFDPGLMVELIRTDRRHGASWLAREAARDLAVVAVEDTGSAEERLIAVHSLARSLALARPSMAAIAMTVAHVWVATTPLVGSPHAQLAALVEEARVVEERWQTAVAAMTEWARRMLATVDGAVYTLSRSHTVEDVLSAVAREEAHTTPLHVIVSESRPGSEGIALASTLVEAGVEATLAPDSACASLMEEAALVIVGADAIRSDGSIVNKVGTRSLALAAQALGKPVYVLAESLKVVAPSYPVEINESASEPMLTPPIFGLKERNPVFDVTPASLITAMVAESGVMDTTAIARSATQAEKAYLALMGA